MVHTTPVFNLYGKLRGQGLVFRLVLFCYVFGVENFIIFTHTKPPISLQAMTKDAFKLLRNLRRSSKRRTHNENENAVQTESALGAGTPEPGAGTSAQQSAETPGPAHMQPEPQYQEPGPQH